MYFRFSDSLSRLSTKYKPDPKSLFSFPFFVEIFLMVTCPIPFYDIYIEHKAKNEIVVNYFLSELLLAIMAMRIFYVLRSYINYTRYTDPYSKKLCQNYGFYANIRFTIKAQLVYEPVKTISILFIVFVMFYSYLYRIFELPYFREINKDDSLFRSIDSYFNACYLSVITLTTVGYGDIFPCTTPGRLVSIQVAITGSILMATVIMVVS